MLIPPLKTIHSKALTVFLVDCIIIKTALINIKIISVRLAPLPNEELIPAKLYQKILKKMFIAKVYPTSSNTSSLFLEGTQESGKRM